MLIGLSMCVGVGGCAFFFHRFCIVCVIGARRAGPAAVGGASEVALKMIRNNDTMRKAAQKEISLLKELAEHDPTNRKHCIRSVF